MYVVYPGKIITRQQTRGPQVWVEKKSKTLIAEPFIQHDKFLHIITSQHTTYIKVLDTSETIHESYS